MACVARTETLEIDPSIALTPLCGQRRGPWRQQQQQQEQQEQQGVQLRSASTPLFGSLFNQRVKSVLHCFPEIDESPIAVATPLPKVKLAAVPGFVQNLDSTRLNTTSITATLEKMEICDNYEDVVDEKQLLKASAGSSNKQNKYSRKERPEEECSSSFQAQQQFQKEINKNRKPKSVTPKKNPKVHKIGIGKKVIGAGSYLKKSSSSVKSSDATKNTAKTPKKCKSPKGFKVSPLRKVVPIVQPKKTRVNKSNLSSSKTLKSQTSNRTEGSGSTLKTSTCAKSPKLRTATRAAAKQYREEIKKFKEKEIEALRQKELEEQKRLEEKEMMKIRKQTIFKAQPIRKYTPLPTVKKRALTDPISPNFSKKRRLEHSGQSSNSHRKE